MLGIDRQNAGNRSHEPGANPGILDGSTEVDFKARNKEEIYDWVNQTLQQLHYRKLKRSARGLVRRYLAKMTGLSRAQATRLLGLYLRGEKVTPKPYRRYRFPRRYTPADAVLLATVDEAHDTLSGPATPRILQRALDDFGDPQYQRLADLSGAQRYRLRKSRAYRQRLATYQKTRPPRWPSANGAGRSPTGNPAICGWTQCIKETWTVSRVCTISTRWMK